MVPVPGTGAAAAVLGRIRIGNVLSFLVIACSAWILHWRAADLVMGLLAASLATCCVMVVFYFSVVVVAPARAGASREEARDPGRIPGAVIGMVLMLAVVCGYHFIFGAWVWHSLRPTGYPDTRGVGSDLQLFVEFIRLGVTNFWPAIVIMLADQSVQLARDFAAMRGTWFMRVFSHILAIQLTLPLILAAGYLLPDSFLVGPVVLLLCLPVEATIWAPMRAWFDAL